MDGWNMLVDLPDDIFSRVTGSLKAQDVCNLCMCCRSLYSLAGSEKVWLSQCHVLGLIPPQDLIHWRNGVSSYKALCHFLLSVEPLLGIWVHQNPELGNVVYVMPAFLSIVACRIIPQELGPLGLQHGPLLWAPVFEILSNFDGSPAFFLHGRGDDDDDDNDYFYPGSLNPVHKSCNVLLLEVQPIPNNNSPPFSQLTFGHRRKLLDIVTTQLRFNLTHSPTHLLFPPFNAPSRHHTFQVLDERRSLLLHHRAPTLLELSHIRNSLVRSPASLNPQTKRKTLTGLFRQMLGKSNSTNANQHSPRENNKHKQLHEFLQLGDKIGLTLNASTIKLSSYRAWPNMHENRFALYKLPMPHYATTGHEFAGLWGGTFGWPPGQPTQDKPGKALFLLFLSYQQDSHGQTLLIATKILEGTHYVLHPNGSAMFIVNIEKSSLDPFPWGTDSPLHVKHAFLGEGIANGYGFRYPGSKPGSLYVIQDELLAFIWKESTVVLTLQRINLQQLLIKGERVNPLPPVANFAYLTKSYSNVFAATLSSPRYATDNPSSHSS